MRLAPTSSTPPSKISPGRDPPVARQQAEQRERDRGLAAARLADDPDRLARLDLERDVANRDDLAARGAVDGAQTADLERVFGRADGGRRHAYLILGSSSALTMSATRLKMTTAVAATITVPSTTGMSLALIAFHAC